MKRFFLQKHIDYFLILVFFVIPPIFTTGTAEYSAAAPVLALLIHAALCAYIICKIKFSTEKQPFRIDRKLILSRAIVTFVALCMLIMNSFAWNAAATVTAATGIFNTESSEIVKIVPEGAAEIAYTVLSLLIAALYEELLYRWFLPEEIKYIFSSDSTMSKSKQTAKTLRILFEILIILLFALGHRYLGIWAVLNAFTAGCILRFICVRTDSVISGFIAHFAYNLLLLFIF